MLHELPGFSRAVVRCKSPVLTWPLCASPLSDVTPPYPPTQVFLSSSGGWGEKVERLGLILFIWSQMPTVVTVVFRCMSERCHPSAGAPLLLHPCNTSHPLVFECLKTHHPNIFF